MFYSGVPKPNPEDPDEAALAPDELPKIEPLTLNGQRVDIQHFLAKEYDDVTEANTDLPQLIEWVNERHQECLEGKHVAEAELDEMRALVYFELRGSNTDENFVGNYPGKMTEEAVGHAVTLDKRVKSAVRVHAQWISWSSRLSSLGRSLQAKLELIRSSEATRRRVFDQQQ